MANVKKTWTVYARRWETDPLEKRDTYDDLDVACEFAEELVRQGFAEAKVKEDETQLFIHVVGN